VKAIFQFFYSSKEKDLPYPNVPTRDVTNTYGKGNKTEPNLERHMENWCSCRSKPVTKAAKDAQTLAAKGVQHYLVLTTRHPEIRMARAVGLMPFSQKNFSATLRKYKERWGDRFPYVSDNRLKICSFSDGFPLKMSKSKDGREHVPGSRYAPVLIRDEQLLRKIVNHFESKKNRLDEFLKNVRFLENRLAKEDQQKHRKYSLRNSAKVGGHCCD
jgi:hypothetical protein